VRAETVLEVLGADALRYFLLREISFGHDGNFTFEALVQRYNGDLANGYGNLVSRVVNMVHKYFGGVVPEAGLLGSAELAIQGAAAETIVEFDAQFDAMDYSRALETLWSLVAAVDGYLTASAPWKKPADVSVEEHAVLQARVLAVAAEAIRIITALAHPILPESTAKVWRQLGLGEIETAAKQGELKELRWGALRPGTHFDPPVPLFPRAEKDVIERMQNLENENSHSAVAAVSSPAANSPASPSPTLAEATAEPSGTKAAPVTSPDVVPAAEPEVPPATPAATESYSAVAASPAPEATLPGIAQIGIEDFAKVELRVAQILVAERIPKADKLLRLEVDLGYEKRQILAGIAQYYEPEKLIGRKVVIVANLAPRKMRGLESNGMVVAASIGDHGTPVLAGFLEDVPLGARLK
jgi:methionyl-tRNA synthetase